MIRMRCALLLLLLVPAAVRAQAASLNPHGALPEGLACTDCHATTSWSPLRADPSWTHDQTSFALEGRHAEVTCALCHAGLVFDRIDTGAEECASCHVDVHQGSMTSPCSSCHGTASFTDLDPGTVHPADFPLEGAHLQISCESCHQNDLGGAYRPLDRECATCHIDDYLSSDLVDHASLGFSTECTECHSTLDFRDVAFDHFTISRGFELTGAHRGTECTTCHSGPGGSVPEAPVESVSCYACHVDDYDREHAGSDFPTDCLYCHTDDTWDGASFEHTFSIFRGRHAGEWDRCEDCHSTPGDYQAFSCFACHTRSETDGHHREEPDYRYDSQTCLVCHPTGND